MSSIMFNNITILTRNICVHTQNTTVVCLDGVKVKSSDFGDGDQGSIPTRSVEKNASPNKFFLKEKTGKYKLHQLFQRKTSAAIGQLARQAGMQQQQQQQRQQRQQQCAARSVGNLTFGALRAVSTEELLNDNWSVLSPRPMRGL